MKKLNYAIIFVSNMERSIAFYRDVLGLPLKFDSPEWTEFDTAGTTLALHATPAAPLEGAGAKPSPAATCHPGFVVPNLGEFHRKMQEAGVRVIEPPKDQDFGGMLALYADPDGLPISIAEAPKSSQPAG